MSLSEDKIAELIAKGISEHKKEKSWFISLGWVSKSLMAIVAFGVAISTLGTGISWGVSLVFQEEINEYYDLLDKVDGLIKLDSLMAENISSNKKIIEDIENKNIQGSNFFAVGCRVEKLIDGKVIRYYRDWDGQMHKIYRDPHYSTATFTYWFFTKEDGTKEYIF